MLISCIIFLVLCVAKFTICVLKEEYDTSIWTVNAAIWCAIVLMREIK